MIPSARADVGVVFALPIEAGRFADRVEAAHRLEAAEFTVLEGGMADRRVVWVVGGAGMERAARACRILVDGHRPRVVIAAGFAGALSPDLERGRAVNPVRVVCPGHDSLDLEVCPALGGPRPLTIATTDRVACAAEDKRRLAEETGADLVDLETWAVAREAGVVGLPCRCIRVVSDAVGDDLPVEVAQLTTATSPWRRFGAALRTVGRRPSAAADLWRLWERAVVDSRLLADVLARSIAELPAASER